MSIWSSIPSADEHVIPSRDNYTGEPDGGDPTWFDVATATSWNDTVRVSAEMAGESYIRAQLTVTEARLLAAHLEEACKRIEAAG